MSLSFATILEIEFSWQKESFVIGHVSFIIYLYMLQSTKLVWAAIQDVAAAFRLEI